MSSIDEILNLVRYSPTIEKKSGEFSFEEILSEFQLKGIECSERRLYRILRGLGLTKNDRGFYTKAEVAVVLHWISNCDRFKSFKQYQPHGLRVHSMFSSMG